MRSGQRIDAIEPGSIGEEMELLPGDILVSINGQPVEDVLDYRFLCRDEYLELLIRRGDEEAVFEVEKDEDEDLGLVFDNGLMDEYRSCGNHCIFCFIDQMPPGMRETLYFKDDDARLSFLQGNYVTLTNLSDHDMERIIRYRLEPINISVHTTDPELRVRMLANRKAGESLKKIDELYRAGIEMNGQIVLCEGINDGEKLKQTIRDLSRYLPYFKSLSVVPVGLTKFREHLYPLHPVSEKTLNETIDIVEAFQREIYPEWGLHFVHASDEFYLNTGREVPEAERYDGYLQIENGVGMRRLLEDEFDEALAARAGDDRKRHVTVVTGKLAERFMGGILDRFREKYPNVRADLAGIVNRFFGETITVSGLITGQDLIAQLKGRDLGSEILITVNMLRNGENVLLDDLTTDDVEAALGVKVRVTGTSGGELLAALLGEESHLTSYRSYPEWEQR